MKQLAKKLYARYLSGELINEIDFHPESPIDFERLIKEELKEHASCMAFHKAVMKKNPSETAMSTHLRWRARSRLRDWLDNLHRGILRHP